MNGDKCPQCGEEDLIHISSFDDFDNEEDWTNAFDYECNSCGYCWDLEDDEEKNTKEKEE